MRKITAVFENPKDAEVTITATLKLMEWQEILDRTETSGPWYGPLVELRDSIEKAITAIQKREVVTGTSIGF